MKRYIFLVAAVALATVSCSKTYDTNPSQPREISFRNWTENLTRARTQGTGTFTSGDDFAVYGYKDMSDNSDPQTVFDDVVVSTSNGSTWTYTTPRFWDANYEKYIFYAISPATIGTEADGSNDSADVNPQTGAFTTRDITFLGNDNDILVADKKTVERGSTPATYFNTFGTVPILFNHVASLVDFKVKKSTSLHDATVTVSAFTLSDIDNVGQLSVSNAYTDTHPVVSWTGTARTTYNPGSGVTPVNIASPITISEDTAFNPGTPATPAAATNLITSLVVLPQTFRASNGSNPQKLTLSYKIAVTGSADTEFENKVLYLCDFDNVDDADQSDTKIASWEPGKHYIFYITLDAHKINFSAEVTDWTSVNGYYYLLN